MRSRAVAGFASRFLVGLAVVALLGAAWLTHEPSPAAAGYDCDPGMNCAKLVLVTPGLGAGTVTGHGINCTVDGGVQSVDCAQIYNFSTSSLTVELTVTAAVGSYYITDLGAHAQPGVPVKAYAYLLPSGDGDTQGKEIRLELGGQVIQLVIKGAGTGVIHHTDDGVVCPPECTLQYDYGETGIIVAAVPDPGSFFKSWTAPCAGQGAACQFDMPKSTTMTVTFGLTPVATATPRPATPKPTVVPTAPPTTAPSPSVEVPSVAPSGPSDAPPSATALPSAPQTGPVTSAAASAAPIAPVNSEGGFGSGLLVGLLIAGIVAAGGGLLYWRQRKAGA